MQINPICDYVTVLHNILSLQTYIESLLLITRSPVSLTFALGIHKVLLFCLS